MKLKEEFITHETDGEQIMVSAGTSFNGIVKSNKTAAFIVDCLKTDTTSAKIIEKMLVQYDVSKETITADVQKIIDTFFGRQESWVWIDKYSRFTSTTPKQTIFAVVMVDGGKK